MPERDVPFELIADLPADLSDHPAEARKQLLSRRPLPPFLSDHEDAARRY